MKTLDYLDIHTHLRKTTDSTVSVASLSVAELRAQDSDFEFACAGIHPWWLEDLDPGEIEPLKEQIKHLAASKKIWAVGETGLDRMYPEFLEQQKELFAWHLELAETHQLPLIIHSVRTGSDFLEIMKKNKPTTPWIFHDFRGNEELVKSFLKLHPDCFFSFGLSLDNSPQVRELLPLIPLENVFLETDNQKHLDIHDIYLRAAESLHVDLDFLKAQIWHNFRKLTPHIQ